MASENNIKAMSETQLAEAYAQIVQAVEATEHIGKKNRLEDQAGEFAGN